MMRILIRLNVDVPHKNLDFGAQTELVNGNRINI